MKYSALVLTALLIIFSAGIAHSQDQAYPDFGGIWDTSRGTLAIWQAEDSVFGIYGPYGEIGGHVQEDGTLEFLWSEEPDDYGNGWIKLGDDGNSFDGMWFSVIEMDQHDTWRGEKLDENHYELADRAALDHVPGTTPETPGATDETGTPDDGMAELPADNSDQSVDEEPVIEPAIPEGDIDALWSGVWDTARGDLAILIVDGVATGTFRELGSIEGTIDGPIINATWSETTDTGVEVSGSVIFWLSEDGTTFRGSYNVETNPDLWLAWSGEKTSDEAGSEVSDAE
ncbi:MAG TPA: hypothetical protein VGB30_12910 [bacterium]|jgi:hypothetical protein